jgi:hypothetical protein
MTPSKFDRKFSPGAILAAGVMACSMWSAVPAFAEEDLSKLAGNNEQVELKVFDGCYIVENGGNTPILVPHGSKDELLLHDNSFQRNLDDMREVGFWECPEDGVTATGGKRIYPTVQNGKYGTRFSDGMGVSGDGTRLVVIDGLDDSNSHIYAYDLEVDSNGDNVYKLKSISPRSVVNKFAGVSDDGYRIAFTGVTFEVYAWNGSNYVQEMKHKSGSDWYSKTFGFFRMRPDGEFGIGFYVKNSKMRREPYFYKREGGTWSKLKGSSFPYTLNQISGDDVFVKSKVNAYSPWAWLPDNKFMMPVFHGSTALSTVDIMSYDPDDPNSVQIVDQIENIGDTIDWTADYCAAGTLYWCTEVESMDISPNGEYLAVSMRSGHHIYIYENIGGTWTRIGVSDPDAPYSVQGVLFFNSPPISYNDTLAISDEGDVFAVSKDRGSTLMLRDADGDGVWELHKDLKPDLTVDGEYPLVVDDGTYIQLTEESIALPDNASFLLRSDTSDYGHTFMTNTSHGSVYVQSIE